jgi:hypothetical protein
MVELKVEISIKRTVANHIRKRILRMDRAGPLDAVSAAATDTSPISTAVPTEAVAIMLVLIVSGIKGGTSSLINPNAATA